MRCIITEAKVDTCLMHCQLLEYIGRKYSMNESCSNGYDVMQSQKAKLTSHLILFQLRFVANFLFLLGINAVIEPGS